jgi:hypothetical protein
VPVARVPSGIVPKKRALRLCHQRQRAHHPVSRRGRHGEALSYHIARVLAGPGNRHGLSRQSGPGSLLHGQVCSGRGPHLLLYDLLYRRSLPHLLPRRTTRRTAANTTISSGIGDPSRRTRGLQRSRCLTSAHLWPVLGACKVGSHCPVPLEKMRTVSQAACFHDTALSHLCISLPS